MNLLNMIERSTLMTDGCKRYYGYLYDCHLMSIKNTWKILSGQYTNKTFVSVRDEVAVEKLGIGRTSIYRHKQTLKSLGLIEILPKLRVRTVANGEYSNNYYHQQITILATSIPRKLIAKLLKRPLALTAKFKKTYNHIISQSKHKINKVCKNLQARVRKIAEKIKPANNISNKLYTDDNHYKCESYLLKYSVNYKNSDLEKYEQLYIESPYKFISACIASSNMHTYSPLNYFIKVYNNPPKENKPKTYKPIAKGSFHNFPQREYDYEKLERLLIRNYHDDFEGDSYED